jgi:hypothetical protein
MGIDVNCPDTVTVRELYTEYVAVTDADDVIEDVRVILELNVDDGVAVSVLDTCIEADTVAV